MADILTPDLCVIGAGAGGLVAAETAARAGARVVLIEKARFGGLGLHATAVPARALAAAADHARAIRDAAGFGLSVDEPRFSARRLHEHVDQVVRALAPRDAAPRLAALGIQIIAAEARFVDPRTISAGETLIRARRFILATGARPALPLLPGLNDVPFFTTETIFDNTRKLTHLVVLGADPRALEIAQAQARLGAAVTVVDAGAFLPKLDPDLADVVLRRLGDEGVVLRPMTELVAILPRSMGIGVAIRTAEGEQVLDASHILVGTTRQPNLENLDLRAAGIRSLKGDAGLRLSPSRRTSNRRVYAVGDVAGGVQSVEQAMLDGRGVVREILTLLPYRPDPQRLPQVVYTDPELAWVGLSERDPAARGAIVTRAAFADNDRARADRNTLGMAKLVTDRAGRILGAAIVGRGAGELIALVSLALSQRLTVAQLGGFVAPHPTYAAIVAQLAREHARNAPPAPWLRQFVELVRYLP
jgi:pyruvate/2-oxoglutarate dehydrogenase complex dihydrolipoamide dehydrogenase (E3) component